MTCLCICVSKLVLTTWSWLNAQVLTVLSSVFHNLCCIYSAIPYIVVNVCLVYSNLQIHLCMWQIQVRFTQHSVMHTIFYKTTEEIIKTRFHNLAPGPKFVCNRLNSNFLEKEINTNAFVFCCWCEN